MQLKYSQSLGGGFDGIPQEAWNSTEYLDKTAPTVFCGMYDARDYLALWRHKGKAYIFWCGSDILNLQSGFLFNDGKLKWLSKLIPGFKFILKKLLTKAEHWCENHVERDALLKWGIKTVYVRPSFFGDKNKYNVAYFWNKTPKVYLSCGKGRQVEYGFDLVERIAAECPKIEFHLYGDDWKTKHENVIIHGRVPLEQMNREIKDMQCGLRANEFDGFSEILAKAALWGHYPISKIKYPMIPSYKNEYDLVPLLNSLTRTYQPNLKIRDFYYNILNTFPWTNA